MAYTATRQGRWSGSGFLLVVTVPVLLAATSLPGTIAPPPAARVPAVTVDSSPLGTAPAVTPFAAPIATLPAIGASAPASDSADEQGQQNGGMRVAAPEPVVDGASAALTGARVSERPAAAARYGSPRRAPPE